MLYQDSQDCDVQVLSISKHSSALIISFILAVFSREERGRIDLCSPVPLRDDLYSFFHFSNYDRSSIIDISFSSEENMGEQNNKGISLISRKVL